TTLVDGEQLTRVDLTDLFGPHDVQGGGLTGDHPTPGVGGLTETAEHERADALRITCRVQGALVHEHQGEGTFDLREQLHGRVLDGRPGITTGVVGQEVGEYLGVRGGLTPGAR